MPTPRVRGGLEASADEIKPHTSDQARARWSLVDPCASLKRELHSATSSAIPPPRRRVAARRRLTAAEFGTTAGVRGASEHGGFMETSGTDVEFDFDVVNLSGSADVNLDELPKNALGRSIRRVRRDTLEHRSLDVSMFQSAL